MHRPDGAGGEVGAAPVAWSLEELHAATHDAFATVFDADERVAAAAPAADPAAELAAARDDRDAAEAAAAELRAAYGRALEEAFARGYEEGRTAGELGEGARLRQAVGAAEQALDELRAGESRWAGTIEENVCALSVAVARHIVGRELATEPATVAEVVRRALKEFPVDQPLVVRVNAGDLAAIEGVLGAGEGNVTAHGARWVVDARVVPGGCLVEGRERIVDGRVDTGLERVYRRLTYTNA